MMAIMLVDKQSNKNVLYAKKGTKVEIIKDWGEGYFVSNNGNIFSVKKNEVRLCD